MSINEHIHINGVNKCTTERCETANTVKDVHNSVKQIVCLKVPRFLTIYYARVRSGHKM